MKPEDANRCQQLAKDLNAYFMKARHERGCDVAVSTVASIQASAVVVAAAIACISNAGAREKGIEIATREFNSILTKAVYEGRKELDRIHSSSTRH